MKVYVVYGEMGTYDPTYTGPFAAFSTQEKADIYIKNRDFPEYCYDVYCEILEIDKEEN